MQFKVGDKAVYPAHGVGVIRAIEEQEFDGLDPQTFYVLKILDNGMTIMVPIDNADAIGMRDIIAAEHVEKIYDILRDRETPTDNQTWNRRYREYINKIRTGDPIEVGKVLRDLALMKMEKNLPKRTRRRRRARARRRSSQEGWNAPGPQLPQPPTGSPGAG